ncbi:hypothetical protein [Leuconostoc suionicum]|uniref:hypothetical protein n=1 Tax=Leuconostoc suionicum TaxID=1511761 RepID=UPI00233F3210|nr:hypothetical protein [Leuconostoc suionicum]MDC2804820.1 hypothetical protein [Leuconostoc suionicum]MDC2822332.1 hypothetical protein [Leuconostoc suionicum]
MKKAIQVQNQIDVEDDELIEDATKLLKSGEFKNDLNLRKTITMFQRRFRIGWHRGLSLANVLRDRGLLVNPIVDEEIANELQKKADVKRMIDSGLFTERRV